MATLPGSCSAPCGKATSGKALGKMMEASPRRVMLVIASRARRRTPCCSSARARSPDSRAFARVMSGLAADGQFARFAAVAVAQAPRPLVTLAESVKREAAP